MSECKIRALSTDNADDFLSYFDFKAFEDNERWANCYCCYYHCNDDNEDWMIRTKDLNRFLAEDMIRKNILKGYLAYKGSDVVGWCNVNDKKAYARLSPEAHGCGASAYIPADRYQELIRIKSVVCFNIYWKERRKGLAKLLLERAIEDAAKEGYDVFEAYPFKEPKNDAANYHGSLSMYQFLGFTLFKEEDTHFVMRKELQHQ